MQKSNNGLHSPMVDKHKSEIEYSKAPVRNTVAVSKWISFPDNKMDVTVEIGGIQKAIDSTEYSDVPVYDFEAKYFGDEIQIIYYSDNETSWVLRFLTCYKAQYETDASWRKFPYVKELVRTQLGHFLQTIDVRQSDEYPECAEIKICTSAMVIELTCKEVVTEKVDNSKLSFFWRNNKKQMPSV